MSAQTLALIVALAALITSGVAISVATAAFRRARPHRPLTRATLPRPARGTDEDEVASPDTRPVVVIYNPVKIDDMGTFRRTLTEAAVDAGFPPPAFVATTADDTGAGQAREAREAHAHLVIVAGGDGTVRQACGALAHSGIPIGIIPAGTGNLLARNLDIPIDSLEGACEIAFTGHDTALDLGRLRTDGSDDAHPFLVIAGVGFDGDMMAGTSSDLKQKIGWAAYVLSGVRALRCAPMTLTMRLGQAEQPTRIEARTLLFASCGQLTAGLTLLPGADPTDGWMEVTAINVRGRLIGWVELAWRVVTHPFGAVTRVPAVTSTMKTARSHSANVLLENGARQVQVDGDPVGHARRLDVSLDPHALIVRTA